MKLQKYLLAGAAAILTLVACDNEKDGDKDDSYYASQAYISSDDSRFTPTSNGGSIAFKAEGGTVAVTVVCGTDWVVENDAGDIVTSTIVSSTTLNLTMAQNTAEEARSATVSVLTATQRVRFATINVTQNAYGAPEITVATEEWTFPAVSSTLLSKEISVNSTLGTWEVENTAEWLTVQNKESSVILTATQNDDPEQRSTRITLTSSDGFRSDYATIRVYQDARASIVLDKDAISFYTAGETVSVSVVSNYDWNLSYDTANGWFKAEKDGDNLVVTTTASNDTESNYEGIITLTAGDGAENIVERQISVIELPASSAADALVLDYTVTITKLNITLPIVGTNCVVNWGDGIEETVTKDNPTHSYNSAGSYVVRITGTVTGLSTQDFASSSNPETALTAVEQWGHTGLRTMEHAFYYCTSLKTIPTDSDGSFANVTGFEYAFRFTGLSTIPEHLFDYATQCVSFYYTFASISSLKTAPVELFKYNTAATDFTAVFRDTGLTTIPENIFLYNTNAEIMDLAFYGTPITTIPENVFANCPKVTTFKDVFQTCGSLREIPEDLFKYNTEVESFSGCFYDCTALTEVPENLFRYNTKVTSLQSVFGYCEKLLKIPVGIFKYNTKVVDFSKTFRNCTALTGESAYDLVEINGVETKIHLYERGNYPDIYTAPTTSTSCYISCTGLSDYSSIPYAWK